MMSYDKKTTVYDVLLTAIYILWCIVMSPRVVRQFDGLQKTGDIVWNAAYDLMIAAAAAVLLLFLDGHLNYLKRKLN